VLNLIKNHNQEGIDKILSMNFYTFQKYGHDYEKGKSKINLRFRAIKNKLLKMDYIRDGVLTYKGEFSSRIYADEIFIGEIFATGFYKELNRYQVLMLLACLVYEQRERTEFYKRFRSGVIGDLKKKLRKNSFLSREKRFWAMNDLSALITPCYSGETIFDILDNSNLLEGDLIRFFRQITDRIGQIRKATKDRELRELLNSCQGLIDDCLCDIDSL
jgi:superfamily II RNA helicase